MRLDPQQQRAGLDALVLRDRQLGDRPGHLKRKMQL
jgi:hypothetical protein